MLVDLRPKDATGKARREGLDRAFLTCNKNAIPFDPLPPTKTSGIRLGTPAAPRAVSARRIPQGRRADRRSARRHAQTAKGDAQVEESVRRALELRGVPVYPGR